MPDQKTAIITGASRGIGAGLVEAFLKQGYNVVATSRNVSQQLTASTALVLIDGDIGKRETAAKVVEAAIKNFGSIDVLVSNAGIFLTKPFTDFSTADFNALVSTNLLGFLYITQLTVKQMLKQESGSVVSITAALADQPILGVNGSVPMITKGGLNSVIRSLAIEYAKQGIRFNAVAPGVVDTPMHTDDPKDFLKTLQPMGKIADVADVVDAVLYLAQAPQVSGEVLHVDGGAHARCEMRAPIFDQPLIAVAAGHVEKVDRDRRDDRPIRTVDIAHGKERVGNCDVRFDKADPIVGERRLRGGGYDLLRLGTEVLHHGDSPLQKITHRRHESSIFGE